jgi:protocatechuate 3,4-dioxygenase beta subunit
MDERLTRGSLLRLAGLAAAGIGLGATEAETASGGPAAVSSGLVSCVLTPEMTEGPFYLPNEKMRRNITERRPGLPLLLHLGVVDVSTCKPIKGAAVDIWHADAGGLYSDEASNNTVGKTFMRGIQRTNASGLAIFDTVYPGWYIGRTVHIHVKVHIGGNVVHTGQLFFRDSFTNAVYRRSPYRSRPGRDTTNATDSIYRNGGSKSLLDVRKRGTGYVGTITMGVHRS